MRTISEIALFDFDGTITYKDSTKEFYKFIYGAFFWYHYYLPHVFLIFATKFSGRNYFDLKISRLNRLIKKIGTKQLILKAKDFQERVLPNLIKHDAYSKIQEFKNKGTTVILVTASMDILLRNWAEEIGIGLITNELELKDGHFTGNFIHRKDCNFEEKLIRIFDQLPDIKEKYIYAYGDSPGDFEMLKIADKSFYNYFKK